MTNQREGYVPETHLGQIKIDGKWMDYARGHREESIRWAKGDPENRRVVDWIHKEQIIWPEGESADTQPRQDADGTPYLAYFTHEPFMASFAWSGHPDQPIEVAYAEAGEPVDARFHATRPHLAGPLPDVLAEFKRQCDEHLAHKED